MKRVVACAATLLAVAACSCGSASEPPASSGSEPCDARGQCPGTLQCDVASNTCVAGGTRSPDWVFDCPVTNADQLTVVLGVGLECLTLGFNTFTDLVLYLGPGETITPDGGGGSLQVVYRSLGLTFFGDASGSQDLDQPITQILAIAPFAGASVEGVTLGMSADQVHALLGKPNCTVEALSMDDYACQGGWLYYDSNNTLNEFQIFAPYSVDASCSQLIQCKP